MLIIRRLRIYNGLSIRIKITVFGLIFVMCDHVKVFFDATLMHRLDFYDFLVNLQILFRIHYLFFISQM